MNAAYASAVAPVQAAVRSITPLIALAGQPNLGKSTLFNLLTGLNQHVGNWPGKTVERREGSFTLGSTRCRLVDLPGTYSLTAGSPEEIIAREFIVREQPDVIVAVVSAASLERSLYLVAELLALETPIIVALNMMDVAAQAGLGIEPQVLQAALGVPVVPLVAVRAVGVRDLLDVVRATLDDGPRLEPHLPEIRADHAQVMSEIRASIDGFVPQPYPAAWVALKLLEGDSAIVDMMSGTLPAKNWEGVHGILMKHEDALLAVASGRYEWIGRMMRAAVTQPKKGQITWTNEIDKWATHPFWGLAILAGILGFMFWLTFATGSPMQAWLERHVIGTLSAAAGLAMAGTPFWLRGLVVDGLLGGAGAVMTFLPIMMIFFAAFGLLEDTGYMARAAYVMDNVMHVMGLHGKSFLPLFLGFGCNVPAVMGTRVIEFEAWPFNDHLAGTAGAVLRASGRRRLPGSRVFWPQGFPGVLDAGTVLHVRVDRRGLAAEQAPIQGPPIRLHHGNAVVSSAECAHDRIAGLAAIAFVREQGRHQYPGDGCGGMGAFGSAERRPGHQLPDGPGQARFPGWRLDGAGLAFDDGADRQLPRQGERHRRVGRDLRQFVRRGPYTNAGCHVRTRVGARLPCRHNAIPALRSHGGNDAPGNGFVEMAGRECRIITGDLDWGRGAGLSAGVVDRDMNMLAQLIQRIDGGGTLDTTSLSVELGVSPALLEAMLEHLQRLGFVRPYVHSNQACSECGLSGNCGAKADAAIRLWAADRGCCHTIKQKSSSISC